MTVEELCNQNIVKTWGISGFPREYEEGCQKMLWTGIKYLAKSRPNDKPFDFDLDSMTIVGEYSS